MTAGGGSPVRQSRRVQFLGGNGFQLAGIVDVPSLPWANHPVVVFSHCFTCNKDLKAIVRIGRALAGAGITVLRYDMTGLGGSGGDFSQTNFTTNIGDLRAAIRFANEELGPVRGLLGHSFGGAASLAVAGEPLDLTSIRAVATLAAPSDTQHLAALMDRMNPAIERDGQGEVEIGGRTWTIRREMTSDFRQHRLGDRITKIRLPLLLVHSLVDETVAFHEALRIYQLASVRSPEITPPAVSLVALDRADHLLAQPPEELHYVAEVLSAFFRRYST